MKNDRLRDLLGEIAEAIEPSDRLDAIRATTSGGRRTAWGWWAVGGAGLVAASVVTALALTTGGTPRGEDPGPADSPSRSTSPSGSTGTDPQTSTVAVYYVGDTPDGPRLYREFRPVSGDSLAAAVAAAVGRDVDDSPLTPLDPDYRVPWPAMTAASARTVAGQGLIEVSLGGDVEGSLHDRGDLSPVEAGLAIEQLVRTAQGVVGERLPVRFLLYGEVTDQVLGVPTSEELTTGSDLAVLAHVSLSDPSEGLLVDNDEPFTVTGVGNSFEANIITRVERLEGAAEIVTEQPAMAGTYEDRLFPFEVTFDLSELPPGDYLVASRTDDPSGQGRVHTDDRRITLVD